MNGLKYSCYFIVIKTWYIKRHDIIIVGYNLFLSVVVYSSVLHIIIVQSVIKPTCYSYVFTVQIRIPYVCNYVIM